MSVNFKLEEMLDRADLLIKEGKTNDAVNVLNDMLLEDPLFGKAHNHLGYIYETKIRDYKRAEEHYKLCVQYAPDYTAVYYNFSILLSTLKKYDELKALLDKAQAVPGINRGTIMNEYAIMYESMGNLDKAIEHYREVIKISFDNKTIDVAMESVVRCEKKKNFLSGGGGKPPGGGWSS